MQAEGDLTSRVASAAYTITVSMFINTGDVSIGAFGCKSLNL
jgi:hypothetical protein